MQESNAILGMVLIALGVVIGICLVRIAIGMTVRLVVRIAYNEFNRLKGNNHG